MTNPTGSQAPEEPPRPQLRVVPVATVTDRETPIGSSNPTAATDVGSTRDPRPRARASLTPGSPVTLRSQRLRVWLGRYVASLHPPDVWAVDRPSLHKQLNYARWGEQHPDSGPLRALSIAWCCPGLVPQAVAYYVAWAAERPGRLLSLYILLAVLMQIPVVRAVLTAVVAVLTAPLTWL